MAQNVETVVQLLGAARRGLAETQPQVAILSAQPGQLGVADRGEYAQVASAPAEKLLSEGQAAGFVAHFREC